MLESTHSPWLVGSLLGLTVVWLLFVAIFFHYLKRHHSSEFLALGQPGFQKKGSVISVLRYIFRRRHRALGDAKFSLLCDSMAICFAAINILFLAALLGYGGSPTKINL